VRSSRLAATIALVALLGTQVGCAPLRQARIDPEAPPTEVEVDARERLDHATCSGSWSWALPGAGQLCTGKVVEGAVLSTLAVAELAGALAAPGGILSLISLVAIQNTWIIGVADITLDKQRAASRLYVPQEGLDELALAPFNPNVLGETTVWLGIIGIFGAALVYSNAAVSLLDEPAAEPTAPVMTPSVVEIATIAGVSTALFTHVAMGEELLFRGVLQASLASALDPWSGWAIASLIFGGIHTANAFALRPDQRTRYLAVDVPFITLVGSYLGLAFMWNDYALAPPVAIHFWYDTLLTLGAFIGSGGELPFSMVWGADF